MNENPEPSTEFDPHQLVVDAHYTRLTCGALESAVGVEICGADTDSELGLTRLQLAGVEQRAFALARRPLGDDYRPLDAVLDELRDWFITAFGGWIPPIGKNRYLVNGLPETKPLAATGLAEPTRHAHTDVQDARLGDGSAYDTWGRGVRVGVLDTRMYPHPALAEFNLTFQPDLTGYGVHPVDGHATFIAGLIFNQAPAASVEARTILADGGQAKVWDVAKAIAGFAGAGVDVLNLSLGCRTTDGRPPLVMQRAVERLGSHTLAVAAAGNHGGTTSSDDPIWPAALPTVVAVGAHDEHGDRARFSPDLPWVTISAHGTDVVSTFPYQLVSGLPGWDDYAGYVTWSGTSFAAARVSGRLAARMSLTGKTAQDAFGDLLDEPQDPVVTAYAYRHDWHRT